jgi:hypothetical protein
LGSAFATAIGMLAISASTAGADTVVVGAPGGGGAGGGSFLGNNGGAVTVANVSLSEPGAHATSPVNGTVVQWRISTLGTGAYALRVLRPASGGQYTAVSSSVGNVTVAGNNAFPANLPIQTGDLIAVDLPDQQGIEGHFLIPGSSWDIINPAPANGATASFSGSPFTDQELLFNADVQFTPASATPPAPTRKKCKKKKHKRSASAAKKCKKKKK